MPDAGQHAPPADFGALGYGPAAYGDPVPDEARQAAATVVKSRYSGTLNDRDEAVLEAAVPVVRAAQRATDEAKFKAHLERRQQGMAGAVAKRILAERQVVQAHLRGIVAGKAQYGNDVVLGALLDAIRELAP